jgi:hypothetical protein
MNISHKDCRIFKEQTMSFRSLKKLTLSNSMEQDSGFSSENYLNDSLNSFSEQEGIFNSELFRLSSWLYLLLVSFGDWTDLMKIFL